MKSKLVLMSVVGLIAMGALAQPIFTSQPADQGANQGYSTTFQLGASGTPPLSYAWFFNQAAMAGASTNKLTITNSQPANAGDYFATVTDSTGSITSRVAKLTVITPVKLDLKIGPNVMIGEARTNPPSEKRSQAEPHLARSMSDPNLVVAMFRESSTFDPGAAEIEGYAVSRDGGRSWSPQILLSTQTIDKGVWVTATDPVTIFDAEGNLFLLAMLANTSRTPPATNHLFVSSDGGATFRTNEISALKGEGVDKHWLAVNTFRGAPNFGRVLVTWAAWPNNAGIAGLRSAYSDDDGKTWSTPLKLTTDINNSIGAQPVFLPDGSCVVLYMMDPPQILVVRSEDGGMTFGKPITLATFTPNEDAKAVDEYFIALSVATDQMAGVIYATWESQIGTGTDARKAILFSKSINRGETWSAPVPVNDTPNKRHVLHSQIAVSPDGQHVTITFYDRRNDPGQGNLLDLYLAESFDAGETWEPNVRVSEFSSDIRKGFQHSSFNGKYFLGDYFGLVPALDLQTPGVVCWIDTRSGYPRAFTATIQRTRGATFETWRKLRWGTNDLANASLSGPAADPDGDGIPNFAEYALGLEPTRADRGIFHTCCAGQSGVTQINVQFRYPSELTDVQFSWEESIDLVHWESPQIPPLRIPPDQSDIHASWTTELTGFRVDPTQNKFVRLVVKQRAP